MKVCLDEYVFLTPLAGFLPALCRVTCPCGNLYRGLQKATLRYWHSLSTIAIFGSISSLWLVARRSVRALMGPVVPPPIPVLPPEVLALIFSNLNPRDQRIAAAASRAFYSAASEAGLYIQRRIHFPEDEFRSSCFTFAEVAVHAARYRRLVALTVVFFVGDNRIDDATRAAAGKQLVDVLSASFLLALEWIVDLDITIPMDFVSPVLEALCREAPRLKYLRIDCVEDPTGTRPPPVAKLPDSFLSARAPNLRRIFFAGIDIGPRPLAAFSGVKRIFLSYLGEFPDLHLGEHFPAATHVELESFGWVDEVLNPRVSLAGLSLDVLSVFDTTSTREPLLPTIILEHSLRTVPEVHVCSMEQPDWDTLQLALPEKPGALALRILGCRARQVAHIMVSPHDTRWRRAALVHDWESEPMSPLHSFAFLGNITYLRFDVNALHTLFGRYVLLTALERVKLDVYPGGPDPAHLLWPWDRDITGKNESFCGRRPERTLGCPRLKEVALFTLCAPLGVDSREAAMLGRALGWESAGLPKLRLVGVTMKEPSSSALLAQAYSSVESQESAGSDSQEDQDTGLWGYHYEE